MGGEEGEAVKKRTDISTRNGAKNCEEMSYQCPQKGWREWEDFCGLTRGTAWNCGHWNPFVSGLFCRNPCSAVGRAAWGWVGVVCLGSGWVVDLVIVVEKTHSDEVAEGPT